MSIMELIAAVGLENLRIQFLDDDMTSAHWDHKKGSRITFGSDVTVDIAADRLTKLGVVIWMDREQVKSVVAKAVAK